MAVCHVDPPSKLYAEECNPLPASVAVTVKVTFPVVHVPGFFTTLLIVGAFLSILLITILLYVVILPATSLTFIITSLFCVNTCLLEDTQVAPLSKLYGVDCKPDSASDAVIVNVTSPFVHAVGFLLHHLL